MKQFPVRFPVRFSPLILLIMLILQSGCLPRGETRSLDQVYQSSKQRFYARSEGDLPSGVGEDLKTIAGNLEQAAHTPASGPLASQVAKTLETLTFKAGYTSRPAFGEIIKQWRAVEAHPPQSSRSQSSITLLASRTFSVLASELGGVRFSLGDREMVQ